MDASSFPDNTRLTKLDLAELGIDVDAVRIYHALRARISVDSSLHDAADELDDAWEAVDEAYDEGFDTRSIENLLSRADRALRRAERAYGTGEQSSATDLVQEAREMIEESFTELDTLTSAVGDRMEAINAYTDAEDELDSAWDEIEFSGKRSPAVEALLDSAESALERAHQAFHERNYDAASAYARDAHALAQEARDSH